MGELIQSSQLHEEAMTFLTFKGEMEFEGSKVTCPRLTFMSTTTENQSDSEVLNTKTIKCLPDNSNTCRLSA